MPRRARRLLIHAASGDNVGGVQASVHLRTTHGLLETIEVTTERGDVSERAVEKAEYFIFAGLSSLIRLLKKKKKKPLRPVKANPPPWDVSLDRTKPKLHGWGDTSSL